MTAAYDDPYADVPPPDEEPGRVATHPMGVVATQTQNRRSNGYEHTSATHRNGCNDVATELQPRYFDVAAFFDGTQPDTPTPEVCIRTDGVGLFYRNQLNMCFGDPEGGKTLIADHCTAEELGNGGKVLRLDLDHNGPDSTLPRQVAFGALEDVLRDPDRFLYVEPEDALHLSQIVAHMADWKPTLVVIDSIGELMPMYKSSSNSADEFTYVHSTVVKPLVRTGACVIGIDHLSRGADSRSFGPTGTAAKRRAIGGTSIRVTADEPFTPGVGGSAWLNIHKDRHGGLRMESPTGDREPLAGKFVIEAIGDTGSIVSRVRAPGRDERNPAEAAPDEDVAAIAALNPKPKSARDARQRLGWADKRARAAYKTWFQG